MLGEKCFFSGVALLVEAGDLLERDTMIERSEVVSVCVQTRVHELCSCARVLDGPVT